MKYNELHEFLTKELSLKFAPLDDRSWDAFANVEPFETGERPLILEQDELTVVVDRNGLQVIGPELWATQLGHDRYRMERLFVLLNHRGYYEQALAYLRPEFDHMPF